MNNGLPNDVIIGSLSSKVELEKALHNVVNKCLPGQFVIVMANEDSERIPLTICDYNKESGVLSLVFCSFRS